MSDQVLSLKWNNHQMSFRSKVACLYNKEKYADVTIACNEKFYAAHKLVLSTCSEYFDKIFSQMDGKNAIIVLKDITQKNIEMLLNYMYLGEVNVDQAELPSLMKAAECLRIKGLAVSDDVEEKPRKRKHPMENTPLKRRHNENSSSNNRKYFSAPDSDNSFNHHEVESKSNTKLPEATVSAPIEDKNFQEILFEPVKEEKVQVETTDGIYFKEAPPPNIPTSTAGSYNIDESCIKDEPPQEPDPQEEFQDYSMDIFDPMPPDEIEPDFNLEQTSNPMAKQRRTHYCDKCNYYTIWKSNMDMHRLVHTGERPFSCTICPYKTRQRGNLKAHMIRKHGDCSP